MSEFEAKLGFRSSFNIIPEGKYRVPPALRQQLIATGFEVGVHDLRHDGFLYRSRESFSNAARQINRYVRDWKADGFRSGFMLHQLDWFEDLEVLYDASTFDTDPFEPQPDGVGTIFPFWVPTGTGGAGYVELPYTLAQDFTLFVILQEKTIDIWKRKIDWIAAQGGMALLIIHPDYLNFSNSWEHPDEFPAALYHELLEYVNARYGNDCWKALPRDIAAFTKQHQAVLSRTNGIISAKQNLETERPNGHAFRPSQATGFCELNPAMTPQAGKAARRICMITHSFYESDNRVLRYAETLAAQGHTVEVAALRANPSLPHEEVVNGVRLFRLQDRFGKKEKSKLAFLGPILRFLVVSSWWMTRRHARTRYDLIHVHNIPDFLVFAAWFPKLTGARVILDIHDIVPEFFCSKFGVEEQSVLVRGLKLAEKCSGKFASHVILANHLWLERYTSRSAPGNKCSVFINNVDSRLFQPQTREERTNGSQIIIFPGGLQWHQGLDIAIHAFAKLQLRLPATELHIYGDGPMKENLVALAQELGLNAKVKFFPPRSVREIVKVMAAADLGVVPKRADSFGNEAYSTKIMEFMSLHVPVVVSKTKIDQFYFNESVVRFFDSGDPEAMAEAMFQVLNDAKTRESLVARASEYVLENSWETRKRDYLQLVDSLCSN